MRGLDRITDAVSFSSTCGIASTKQRVFVPRINFQTYVIKTTLKIIRYKNPSQSHSRLHNHRNTFASPAYIPSSYWLIAVLCMKMYFPLYESKMFISIVRLL